MKRLLLAFGIIVFTGLTPPSLLSWEQSAGAVGHPQAGGPLPQDLDTLTPAITAAGSTQATATFCGTTICDVSTVASGTGLAIRQCTVAPMRVLVIDRGANSLQVYGSGANTINGNAAATGVSQPAVSTSIQTGVVEYVCVAGGT